MRTQHILTTILLAGLMAGCHTNDDTRPDTPRSPDSDAPPRVPSATTPPPGGADPGPVPTPRSSVGVPIGPESGGTTVIVPGSTRGVPPSTNPDSGGGTVVGGARRLVRAGDPATPAPASDQSDAPSPVPTPGTTVTTDSAPLPGTPTSGATTPNR